MVIEKCLTCGKKLTEEETKYNDYICNKCFKEVEERQAEAEQYEEEEMIRNMTPEERLYF